MIHEINKKDNEIFPTNFNWLSEILNIPDISTDKIDNLCEKNLLKRIKSENNIGPYKLISKNDVSIICPICLDTFKEGLYKRVLECDHVFHKKCIDPWIKNEHSCPVCRKSV